MKVAEEFRKEFSKVAAEIPSNVTQEILNNFRIDGALPITQEQMEKYFQSHSEMLIREFRATNSRVVEAPVQSSPQVIGEDTFPVYSWGGKLHFIPENYTFPNCTTKALWNHWFFGTTSPKKIRPFRWFQNSEFKHQACITKLKKARILINVLIKSIAPQTLAEVQSKSFVDSTRTFELAFHNVCTSIMEARVREYGDKAKTSRFEQLQWATICKETSKYKIFPSKD